MTTEHAVVLYWHRSLAGVSCKTLHMQTLRSGPLKAAPSEYLTVTGCMECSLFSLSRVYMD